jgi:predicted metalloprotease with PDZ domain
MPSLNAALVLGGLTLALPLAAQAPRAPVSAPIGNIRYDVTFDAATAKARSLKVAMQFSVTGPGDVLLSLPSWTPGAYEVSNFARWVSNFSPTDAGGKTLRWDKLDYDTWRIRSAGAKSMTVAFDFEADTLDNAMSWSKPDFALFNGTNILLYPEGRGFGFPATVRIHTEPGWLVATGMHAGSEAGSYAEKNYHDLVDMPFFIGRYDLDSATANGHTLRLATYPAGTLTGSTRDSVWKDIVRMVPAESAVFGETPWDSYNVMMIFDSTFGGGSALEHQDSHVGVYTTNGLIGGPILASITAHEMFHSWNVKRMRPADMMPYRYDVPQPTVWLWVSEGITDYYADLTLSRGGIADSTAFFETTAGKISQVDQTAPVALEDASLSTWIHPTDGTGYLYYPKGSLAGFMLDIIIRDASNNKQSLDGVMQGVYRATYKAGRGFNGTDWWGAVSRAAGGKSFTDFNAKYVDGREPYPWDTILPLAGLRLVHDTLNEARLGISTAPDSNGTSRVTQVFPEGAAEASGMQVGDVLISLGDLKITTNDFGPAYRSMYNGKDGLDIPFVVRRGGQTVTLPGKVKLVPRVEDRMEPDPNANEKAARIRHGILTGTTN